MAEIVDTLRLDIDRALADVNRLERALDVAIAPIEVEVDTRQADELADTLREIERIAERATTETADMALAAGRAETNFEDLARALGVSEDEARRLTGELLEAQAAGNRLEDAARDVARQLGLSDTEAERLTRSLRQADAAADDINVTSTRTVGVFGNLRTAASGIAGAFAAIGGAVILGAAIRGANAAVQQFAQLEDSINAVNVIFGTAADTVLEFGETAAQSAGLSASAFNQAVTPLGALLQNFGFDAREAADASVILVQRAADLASVLGGDVQTALAAVSSALRGQSEPLTAYGATISAARVEQFALANGLAATKAEITDAITLQARYGLILEDTAVVSGDYAATATDLANAQRTAAAEAGNVAAAFGKALAPAFEAVLVQAVPLLNFFESLTPAIAASAEEASGAAAVFTEFATGIVLGLGGLGDVIGGVGDALSAFPALIEDVAAGIADGDASFSNFGAQMDDFNQRTANQFIRVASQSIPAAIARGTTPINAFGEAIAFLAQQDDGLLTVQQSFERLGIQSGLTDAELSQVTQSLIDQAVALGLNADEVAFLNDQLEILFNNTHVVGNEVGQAAASMAGFGDGLSTAGTRFTTFATDTEAATDRAATALAELSAEAEAQVARTTAAFNLFEELPEKIKGSFIAAVEELRIQAEAIADFDINIAILRALGLDALADEFREKGLAARDQLAAAINDIPAAIDADLLLQGIGVIGDEMFDEIVDRFVEAGITPADITRLKRNFASPEVIAAAEEAARLIAIAEAESYHETLSSEFDQLIPEVGGEIASSISQWRQQLEDEAATAAIATANSFLNTILDRITPDSLEAALGLFGLKIDLTEDGIYSGETYIHGVAIGVSSASAAEELRGAITNTIDDAIFRDSPPKLFLDIGKESGDAFWSGFNQADLTLKTAVPDLQGSIITGSAAGAVGGVNVEVNINNPSMNDVVSDTARVAQITSSIAASYRSVVPNGM